jgi:hypothetical protein
VIHPLEGAKRTNQSTCRIGGDDHRVGHGALLVGVRARHAVWSAPVVRARTGVLHQLRGSGLADLTVGWEVTAVVVEACIEFISSSPAGATFLASGGVTQV